MLKHPLYLVPIDFTDVSTNALKLALSFAKDQNGCAYLLHVVDKTSEKIEARLKMEQVVAALPEEDQKYVTTKVIVGDVYGTVGNAGDILKSTMIVMGTHGAKGMQKLFGSHAVKMISSTSTPLLIVQSGSSMEKIQNIVMPFSFMKESIQITTFAANIAERFNAKIHLVGFHDKDEWLEQKTQSNQLVVRRHLDERGIAHEIVNLPRQESYEAELLKYASKVDADFLAAAYFKEGVLPVPNSFIQHMIENELQIPLLTVNSEELAVVNSHYSFVTV